MVDGSNGGMLVIFAIFSFVGSVKKNCSPAAKLSGEIRERGKTTSGNERKKRVTAHTRAA